MSALLEVRDLTVTFATPDGPRRLLDDVSLDVRPGESVGIVGASGAGKSTLGSAIMRLLPPHARIGPGAAIRLGGDDLLSLDEPAMRERRGRRIAMVFQEPLRALNPAMRIGDQLAESLTVHRLASRGQAHARAVEMLARVGIADATDAARRHPHEFSGGMRQRILIAGALLPAPALIIADEPTTSLDLTIQAQVLDLLDSLRRETGAALMLISHDLDVVGERCGRVVVLDRGRVVEDGAAADLMSRPASPTTQALVAARASRTLPPPRPSAAGPSLLEVRDLRVTYRDRRRAGRADHFVAVHDVRLDVARGEVVAIVGESGCGKSSLALATLRLTDATGRVLLDGEPLDSMAGEELRRARRRIQWIPQDAGASLTPHLRVRELVAEGMEVHGIAVGADAARRADALLTGVGLDPALGDRLPPALSAGERQRVAIARALSTGPDLLVCDEPVSSVDATNRAFLLDLFARLRHERGLAMILITHDVTSVRRLADRVLVMYLGRIVESGTATAVLGSARMPYTQALLAAEPTGDPEAPGRRVLPIGEPPSALRPPSGCAYHPRCAHPAKDAQCAAAAPELRELGPAHRAACWKA